ncbi:UPF0187 protein [Lachnellula subtilissima]|uniref:UPF0187 protein n=1 Tax=Lachnellula subtilissima TaxID=602034 RepID=A0A8H8U9D8_9HELO|nr:UPF0187 protein [Lachnellula subtilissima]
MPLSFSRRSLLPIRGLGTKDKKPRRPHNNTYPLANSSRKKDRRWPLVFRFSKGSVHGAILFPVFIHSLLAGVIVFINQHINSNFNLPSSIIPSLSIVVGLMLVFRNQTAYSRFWGGRMHLNEVTTAIRCLARQFLVLVPAPSLGGLGGLHNVLSTDSFLPQNIRTNQNRATEGLSKADELKTIETVKILIAMLYTVKNHLRAEWGVADWFHNAASSNMLAQLNQLTHAYGSMEVIRLVPIPVAHLIHHKQTLALFCGILPFAMASEMDWWAVPLVAFVAFTLYGIEGIAQTYEDPFGVHKIDINMDDIVEDARREVEVMLTAWQTQGPTNKGIFRPRVGENTAPSSPRSEYGGEFFSDIVEAGEQASPGTTSGVKFVVSDANELHRLKMRRGLGNGRRGFRPPRTRI